MTGNTFTDMGARSGTKYLVSSQEYSGLESRLTPGGKPLDPFAPSAPSGLRASGGGSGVKLSWRPSADRDVDHYSLYFVRAGDNVELHQHHLVASPEASATEFLDWDAPVSAAGTYLLTAVDRYGNVSPPAAAHVGNPGDEAVAQARSLIEKASGKAKRAPRAPIAGKGARRGSSPRAPAADMQAIARLAAAGRKRYIDRVIAGVEGGNKARVYVDFGGRLMRARIVGADARNLLVNLRGGEIPLTWQSISPRRFAALAAKYAGAGSDERIDLAALYAQAGRKDDAAEALRGITARDEATRTTLAEIKKYIASGL